MTISVQMPALGESVTEGTVTRWLKQEGDRVEVDEPLLEVSTDKVDTEIPSPAAGVLQRIVAGEDETVEVGGELAVIGDESGGDGDGSGDGAGAGGGTGAGADTADDQSEPALDGAEEGGDSPSGSAVDAPAEEAEDAGDPVGPPNQAAEPAKPSSGGGGAGTPITMPELGESVTEGTVTRWLKAVGDEVAVDEPLLEVSTDKVDTEIPSPVAGTLLEITAGEDETVGVGGQLAVIGDASAAPAPSAPAPEPQQQEQPEQQEAPSGAATPDAPAAEAGAQAPAGQEPMAESTSSNGRASGQEAAAAQERSEREGNANEWPDRPTTNDQEPAGQQQGGAPEGGQQQGGAQEGGEQPGGPAAAPYVTPLVRKLAGEHDVDLSTVTGTGVGGRIRKQDVLAAAEEKAAAAAAKAAEPEPAPTPAPAAAAPAAPAAPAAAPAQPTAVPRAAAGAPQPGTTVKMPRLRQVIAQRMSESLQRSAQLTTVQEVDVTRVAKLRAQVKGEFERREGVKLTYLPFFAKATVEALRAFPQVNASINDETKEVTYHGSVHLAIAVDTPRGLLVPVIKDAQDLSIAGLAKRIADVAARTRDGKIGPDELSGGTFTITNIGSAGALFDTPIINQPQVAILGTGAIKKEPRVVAGPDGDDVIAVRSVCYLPLTYDHRLVDGADAGRFVSAIRARLEEGAFAAELGA